MWVKATDLDGKAVWINMLQARLVRSGKDGGCSVIFGRDDAVDLREEPQQLVRGEPRWPNTSEGVGFIRRTQPEEPRDDAEKFETSLTRLMDAQRETLHAVRRERDDRTR